MDIFTNCTFVNEGDSGGAVFLSGASASFTGCLLSAKNLGLVAERSDVVEFKESTVIAETGISAKGVERLVVVDNFFVPFRSGPVVAHSAGSNKSAVVLDPAIAMSSKWRSAK